MIKEMYADTELIYPYFHSFSQQAEHLHDFCRSHYSHVSFGNMVQTSTISDYDLGGEGDLFKAPEPIIEEPTMNIDPMTAAISLISCGENISPQTLEVADLGTIENDHLLSEFFYDCKKDMLAKDAIETPLSEILDIKLGEIEGFNQENDLFAEGSFLKSVSSDCLSSIRPTFLDFPTEDFEYVYGMRRAFSEGDMKTLANKNVKFIYSHNGFPPYHGICSNEDRMQKLSRYRDKKSKRNFGRKIKYACRKALADNQPRFRGRFAKTEESK